MRTQVLIGFAIGGGLYQFSRYLTDNPLTLGTWFDSLYWGASVLILHWFIERARAFGHD